MKTSDFDYTLPEEFIAQAPLQDRAASRLMVLDRRTGRIVHDRFRNIPSYLRRGDCLVLNETKVIPAKIWGRKADTGARIEALLLREVEPLSWEALLRPAKRARPGAEIIFAGRSSRDELRGRVEADLGEGRKMLKFIGEVDLPDMLKRIGETPLPPYIHNPNIGLDRYQTVYATREGSVAAPTAGFHFDEDLIREISQVGIRIARIILHIGLDTFRPIKKESVEEHKIHSEYFEVSPEAAELINITKEEEGRIVAVGTSTVRALETAAKEDGVVSAQKGHTELYIVPGFKFKIVDAIITNFHLPKSSLLVMVSAFAGRDKVLRAYEEAKKHGYRFYSFGDAMLIQ